MQEVIMIRVTPDDYERWITEHEGAKESRLEYGITDGPVYRDSADPNTVLVQLNVEDTERAKGWFRDDRFKDATERAGRVSREIYFAKGK